MRFPLEPLDQRPSELDLPIREEAAELLLGRPGSMRQLLLSDADCRSGSLRPERECRERGINKAGRPDDVRSNTMAMQTHIRRLRERVARAADSLIWYYRTRPDAWRSLAAPGLGAFLTLWLSVAWGLFGPLLALVVVGSFAVFAIELIEELHSLEVEAKAGIELEAGDVPWLAGLTEEESSQPSTEARALEAEGPLELDLPGLPTLDLGDEPAPAVAPPAKRDAGLLASEPARAAARSVSDEPVYELREVAEGAHLPLQAGPSFLEACDIAFELIEENDPAELEIVRVTGEEQEIVWTYRRSESAAKSERAGPADVAGLDVTRSTGPLS